MASKDYYVLLGIPRTASAAEIRNAFRELAKKYHPDRAGSEGTAHFQDIVEAYEVLSDPEKRQQYNWDSHRTEPIRPRGAGKVWGAQPEPFITDITPLGGWREGYAAFADPLAPFWERRPSQEFRAPQRRERLHVTVTFSRDEAVRGGRLPLTMPAVSVCPTCRGTGHGWCFPCASCRGYGTLATQQIVYVRIPPQIRDGSMLEVPLDHYGLPYVLHVYIRVDPWSL